MPGLTTQVPGARKLYFVSGPLDFALIGGLSILTFVALRLFYAGERTASVITLAIQLSWVCNWPHFAATSYRLYHSKDNVRQYPLTALLAPLVVLAGAAGSFAWPRAVAPWFVKLVTVWSPYHFSGQTLGVCLLYARRAGIALGKRERFALSSFIYSTFVAQTVRYEMGIRTFNDSGIPYPSLGLPHWAGWAANAWMIASGVALLFLLTRGCLKARKLIPPIVLLPALAQWVWFAPGGDWRSFVEFVPFFHSLQYLVIAWALQLGERRDAGDVVPSRRFVLSESARWGAKNVALGAALFWGLPHLAAWFGTPLAFATGVIVSAVQLHHFFIDGVIWKLKRRSVSSPLMVDLDELLRPPAPAEVPA